MTWWIWILLGLGLLAAELLTPGGFFILFFGAGAIAVGVLAALWPAAPEWLQWLAFPAVSILGVLGFRKPLRERFLALPESRQVDSMAGETAVAAGDIPPNGTGRVELRGAAWNARNLSDAPIREGQICRVEKVEDLLVFVRPA
jgi:membrane protein implicated in regulation of membrane protease activity